MVFGCNIHQHPQMPQDTLMDSSHRRRFGKPVCLVELLVPPVKFKKPRKLVHTTRTLKIILKHTKILFNRLPCPKQTHIVFTLNFSFFRLTQSSSSASELGASCLFCFLTQLERVTGKQHNLAVGRSFLVRFWIASVTVDNYDSIMTHHEI